MATANPIAALAILKDLAEAEAKARAQAAPATSLSAVAAAALKYDAQQARTRRDLAAAAGILERAVALDPQDPELLFLLGTTLYEDGRVEASLQPMRRALELAPDNASVLANLGRILLDLDRDEEAEATLRRGLEIAPRETAIIRSLATLLRDRGDAEGAADLWRRLLALRPADAEAHYNIANAPRFEPTADQVRQLELLERRAGEASDKAMLGFALFRAHEAMEDVETAFNWLTRSNAAIRTALRYDQAVEQEVFAAMAGHFDGLYFDGLDRGGGEAPVFIVGMPRSGTSLAEQILASHPQVHGAGERPDMGDLVARFLVDPARPGLALEGFAPGCAAATTMARSYLAALRRRAGGRPRFTDKMPLNFRWVGIIKTLFPDARIVHCTRPPIETCMSIYASLFGSDGNRYGYDLVELGRYYGAYVRLMRHWHAALGPEDILQFDLQALKRDQEGETRRLLSFCGLSWDDRCLAFGETERAIKTLSAQRVRQGLDRSRDRRTAMFRPFLGPLEEALAGQGVDPDGEWNQFSKQA